MRTERQMYMLTLDGLPVVVFWGSDRKPIYRHVGQTGAPVWLYKTRRTVERHAKIAQSQHFGAKRYGYVIVMVPS